MKTDEEGRLTDDFLISPYPSDAPHWYLKLVKEGFDPVVIDIKPASQPKGAEKTPLNIEVEMRPKAQLPR